MTANIAYARYLHDERLLCILAPVAVDCSPVRRGRHASLKSAPPTPAATARGFSQSSRARSLPGRVALAATRPAATAVTIMRNRQPPRYDFRPAKVQSGSLAPRAACINGSPHGGDGRTVPDPPLPEVCCDSAGNRSDRCRLPTRNNPLGDGGCRCSDGTAPRRVTAATTTPSWGRWHAGATAVSLTHGRSRAKAVTYTDGHCVYLYGIADLSFRRPAGTPGGACE
jgi:hypothetical protein